MTEAEKEERRIRAQRRKDREEAERKMNAAEAAARCTTDAALDAHRDLEDAFFILAGNRKKIAYTLYRSFLKIVGVLKLVINKLKVRHALC